MSANTRFVLAAVLLCAVFLVPGRGRAAEPTAGVECSWTCHCARQMRDCDKSESQWEVCLDTAPTRHPDKVESCDRCKQVAEEACRKRVCPPDPNAGPKFVFQYFCDGRAQALSAVPQRIGDAMLVSPSVARPEPGREAKPSSGKQGATRAEQDVKCTYHCACSVATGMCDDREQRSRLCVDKEDSSATASSCISCMARAQLDCWARKCPLAGGTSKVMTGFECPVP